MISVQLWEGNLQACNKKKDAIHSKREASFFLVYQNNYRKAAITAFIIAYENVIIITHNIAFLIAVFPFSTFQLPKTAVAYTYPAYTIKHAHIKIPNWER